MHFHNRVRQRTSILRDGHAKSASEHTGDLIVTRETLSGVATSFLGQLSRSTNAIEMSDHRIISALTRSERRIYALYVEVR